MINRLSLARKRLGTAKKSKCPLQRSLSFPSLCSLSHLAAILRLLSFSLFLRSSLMAFSRGESNFLFVFLFLTHTQTQPTTHTHIPSIKLFSSLFSHIRCHWRSVPVAELEKQHCWCALWCSLFLLLSKTFLPINYRFLWLPLIGENFFHVYFIIVVP